MRGRGQAHRQHPPEEGLTADGGAQAADGPSRGLAAATLAAVVVAAAIDGGYRGSTRGAFIALAGIAFLAALLADERGAPALMRRPPMLVLWALALLSAASAIWTVAEPADAIRWAAVIAAYAALAVAAGTVARRPGGIALLAGVIAALAALAAVWGLTAAALHAEPWAERIYRRWQPGGPFQYPPALALLQVAALPALLRAMVSGAPRTAALGAAAAALATETLALGTSRFALVSAVAIAAIALVAPAATVGGSRARVAAALAMAAAAGAVAFVVAGGTVPRGDSGGAALRLIALAGAAALVSAGWWTARSHTPETHAPERLRRLPAVAILAVVGVLGAGLLGALGGASVSSSGPGQQGFTHGRVVIWEEARRAFEQRPLAGAGADAFLAASEPYQAGAAVRYAHSLPLELAVELGVAGLLLALALYGTAAHALWRARGQPALWLLGPGVIAFLAFNLVDWTWHLAGAGAIWAVGLGGIVATIARVAPMNDDDSSRSSGAPPARSTDRP